MWKFWDMEDHDPDVYADAQASFTFDGENFSINVPARSPGRIGGEKFIYAYDDVPAITVSGRITDADFDYTISDERIFWSCYDVPLTVSPQSFAYTHRYASDGANWREEYKTSLEFSPANVQKDSGRARVSFSLNRTTGELYIDVVVDCHWKTEYANGYVEEEFQEQVYLSLTGSGIYR